MKKGISLIVLVITIIVMIILAASVVITLSNTGVINRASEAVDLTNESQVQDLAALIWADAYMDGKRGTELETEVTTKLSEHGVTATDWNITVSDTGVTVTSKNNSSTTLGSLIKGSEDYGKTVDYTVMVDGTTYSNWQIYYEDEENEYVFLILNQNVNTSCIDSNINETKLTVEQEEIYRIFKLGQQGYDVNTNENKNSMFVRCLIKNYSSFANKDDYGTNVVGAIGAPTIELLSAGYNSYHNTIALTPLVDMTYNEYNDAMYEYICNGKWGYFINQKGQTNISLQSDGFYFGMSYCLASPSAVSYQPLAHFVAYSEGVGTGAYFDSASERPVVCLKSSIPATVGTTTDFSLVK